MAKLAPRHAETRCVA